MNLPEKSAVVLFAHGSRDPLWHLPIQAVAQRLSANSPHLEVRCAYLELSPPDLPTVCQELAGLGCTHITVLPMFLGVGRHAREDLPVLVARMRETYPAIAFTLQAAVCEDPRLIQLLAQIAAE